MSSTEDKNRSLFEKYPVYFGIGGAIVVTGTLFGLFMWKTRKREEILELEDHILDEDYETQPVSPIGNGDGNIDIL